MKLSVLSAINAAFLMLLGLVPLALIAWQNPRALPVGLAAWGAFVLVSPLAWIVYLQSSQRFLAGALVVFAVVMALTVAGFRFAAVETGPRILWSVASFVSWIIAIYFVPAGIESVQRDIRMDRDIANVRAENAEIARKTADLTANPAKRAPVLDSTTRWYVDREGITLFLGQVRYVTFGDPAKDPGGVSVWAIVTLTDQQRFDVFNHNLKKLFVELNYWLGKAGYSWPIAAGAVESRDVMAAGGDTAYFGRAGERVVPQWPATKLQEAIHEMAVPPLTAPQRVRTR